MSSEVRGIKERGRCAFLFLVKIITTIACYCSVTITAVTTALITTSTATTTTTITATVTVTATVTATALLLPLLLFSSILSNQLWHTGQIGYAG